jgi:transcriptional regulator with GAF, ATPase, and Fis domain
MFRNPFKEEDLDTLSYFASQAAIAMDNAQAYEQIRILNEELSLENQYYEQQESEVFHFEEIIGKSEEIKTVLSQITQVADTDSNVLILGETGVGKELVARAIHRRSQRKDKAFIRVNCTAFPETLIASELFGHEKGAFTGATERRIGRFEMANKGTIFLDEIGDIPLNVQVRLLRVLQQKEFERIGGKSTIHSDFRLITATNHDLFNDVKLNLFREDLYYRLNVFPIHLPPLRDRNEDIPLLAYYFLNTYASKFNKNIEKILKSDMEKMVEYDWPGNVREKENVIERGLILSSGTTFKMPELKRQHGEAEVQKGKMTFKEMETNYIISTLKAANGKIRGVGGAAEIMDIHPNTLYSKMRRLGIKKTVFAPK